MIRPTYVPETVFYEDFDGQPVRLVVRDDRREEDKIFYRVGIVALRERSKGDTELEPRSQEIVSRSLRQAMVSSGYILRDDARVLIDVTIRDFIYRQYASSQPQFTVNIELGISVRWHEETLLTKVIAERVERRSIFGDLYKEEEMFSECLTKIVDKVTSDYSVIAAVKRGHEKDDL